MENIIDSIIKTDFNKNLLLDEKKLDHNFYAFKETKSEIHAFTHDDLINDWLIERIRRFNTSALYLIDSLNNAIYLKKRNATDKNIKYLIRRELRNICINIEMYIDKVFSMIRYYFFFDITKTEKTKDFIQTFEQFKSLDNSIDAFLKYCNNNYNNSDLLYINCIRCDEIHNESQLDLHDYSFDADLHIIDHGYKIGDEQVLDKINKVIMILIEMRKNLQTILENIKPNVVYKFVKDNSTLKNIVQPKIRSDYKINKKLI